MTALHASFADPPREFSRPEEIANGANVLLHTLLKLDKMKLD